MLVGIPGYYSRLKFNQLHLRIALQAAYCYRDLFCISFLFHYASVQLYKQFY